MEGRAIAVLSKMQQFELGRHVENKPKPFDAELLPFLRPRLSEGEH
ncbi:hypothetical protein [Mesorhizobium sp.]|nr:hypothetical protein [Mesorhizobium sp.]